MADARFQQEFLKAHNAYRKRHSAPPLEYNDELNATAQSWANHLLASGAFGHSNTRDGENIYMSAGIKLTGRDAVDAWFSEIQDYNFSYPGFSGSTGHFTQVVWKSTTELGVGMATDGYRAYVVGQYRPPGNMNMPGYFAKNVLQAGKT
ncbi:Golgi-associated plant pathogenesis-related protein 1-like [Halichoeres trimaculatus]|uniref:Golgi-associated plant pathogenesis-related protein 1-like n=1 Tax=Halichoeres trimaculatus TaxID=147232 RepID=UPI003D9E71A0